MADIKLLVKMVNVIFVSFWGLTVVDLSEVVVAKADFFVDIDSTCKTFMAVAGAVYFIIQIPHRIRVQKIEKALKEQQLKKIKRENENN